MSWVADRLCIYLLVQGEIEVVIVLDKIMENSRMDKNFRSALWRALVPVVDGLYTRLSLMEAEGFYAPRQQLNFEESFCNGSDEIRDSRLARVESIKETWIGHGTYQSSVLNEMRIRSEDWLSKHPGVLSMFPDAVTPGKQRYVDLFLSNRSEFDRLRHPFLERERAFRQEEIRQFCTDLSRSSLFSLSEKLDRVMFYQAVLAEECPTAAYFYDKSVPEKDFLYFQNRSLSF